MNSIPTLKPSKLIDKVLGSLVSFGFQVVDRVLYTQLGKVIIFEM